MCSYLGESTPVTHTTVNHFAALHLVSVWDLITRWNTRMPFTGSGLNLITFSSDMWKANLMTASKAELLLFWYFTSVGHQRMRCSEFRSSLVPGTHYRAFLRGARRLNDGYYIFKLKKMQRRFQQCSKICMVGLIVLTGSSGLSNRLIWCIQYLSELLLDQQIWCEWMLHQIGSIAYGL